MEPNVPSFPKSEFRIQTKAMDLVDYTLRITENTNYYPKWTRSNLVKYIRDTAVEILQSIIFANSIRENGATPYPERAVMQEKAIRLCSYLVALIDLSETSGRINARQRQFWGTKVNDVRNMTRAWADNEHK